MTPRLNKLHEIREGLQRYDKVSLPNAKWLLSELVTLEREHAVMALGLQRIELHTRGLQGGTMDQLDQCVKVIRYTARATLQEAGQEVKA